jgi:hypothetical protein
MYVRSIILSTSGAAMCTLLTRAGGLTNACSSVALAAPRPPALQKDDDITSLPLYI